MNKRNGNIEIWRFVAGISIAVYHFEWLYIGGPVYLQHFYIWVEFFYVISGFFLAVNISRDMNGESNPWRYVFAQIKKVYPVYLLSFICCFVIKNYIMGWTNYREAVWNAKWEILLCNMAGFNSNVEIYNKGGAGAFISALLIGSLFISYFIYYHRKAYMYAVGPLMVLAGYSYILNHHGNLSQWMALDTWGGIFNVGVIRACADMSVGAVAALVVLPQYKKMIGDVARKAKDIIVIGINLAFVAGYFFLILARKRLSFSDLVLFPFCCAGIIVVLYGTDMCIPKKMEKIILFSGKMAFPIFLFHYCTIMLLTKYVPGMGYVKSVFIYITIMLFIGAGIVLGEKEMKKRWKSFTFLLGQKRN